jgi:hypothetical protein
MSGRAGKPLSLFRCVVDVAQRMPPDECELAAEPVPRCRDGEQRSEGRDRVDRLAALLRPVVVLQVEPEREFVERQRRTGTVGEGGRA